MAPDIDPTALGDDPAVRFEIEFSERLPSTNRRGRELAVGGATDTVVIAGRQTAGRGRRDRAWASPPGGVYLSVVCRPDVAAREAGLLTLAGAVAAATACEHAGVAARIKWPNDVVVEVEGRPRKLAGVLTETSVWGDRLDWAVVGIGVNVDVDPADLPRGAASLRGFVEDVDRTAFIRDLLVAFDALLGDPRSIVPAWSDRARTPGTLVRVETADRDVVGRATGVDPTGALLVETGAGTVRVTHGEVTHLHDADRPGADT